MFLNINFLNSMTLDAYIESILFFKAEALSIKKLAEILNAKEGMIEDALVVLQERLRGRGVVLLRKEDKVMLGSSPEAGVLIEKMIKDELSKDLGKAGLETLAIVLYRGPVTRSMIDYIRGVNSTFILRNLLVRGLVEKIPNPDDQRSLLYRPTFELLAHLGVAKIEDLPEYSKIQEEIHTFIHTQDEKEEGDAQGEVAQNDDKESDIKEQEDGRDT